MVESHPHARATERNITATDTVSEVFSYTGIYTMMVARGQKVVLYIAERTRGGGQ